MKKTTILAAALACATAFAQSQSAGAGATQKGTQAMDRIDDLLAASKAFFLATADGDQPKLRPLGAHHLVDGKVWLGVGEFKNVYRQLVANPKCELVALQPDGGKWLRWTGRATFAEGAERERLEEVFLNAMPGLRKIYDKSPGKRMMCFTLAESRAELITMMPPGEVLLDETPGAAAKDGPAAKLGASVVVVYFSWSPDGNTRFAAETIAKKAGADVFEITAETPYKSDYRACCEEAKPECQGKTLRPIKSIEGLDLAKYDVVFVGTPNWWGTMAPPVRTWIEQSKPALKGKSVCLFQTHGGGGMQRVGSEFAEAVGDAAKVLPPKAFRGASVKSSVPALEAFVDERLTDK